MNTWIAGYIRHMRSAGLAELTTIDDRREVLERLDRELPLGLVEATVEELQDWLARPGWSAATRENYHGHVTAFYRWAADSRHERYLSYDPSASLVRPKVPRRAPRPCTDEELAKVLDVTVGRWRLYCLLAAYSGLRCCEISIINREDITKDTLTIQGKGGTDAALPTHPIIWSSVEHFPAGRLALNREGNPVTPKYISVQTSRYLSHRGLPTITLHRLRHWYATTLLNQGANLRTVQELMRHSSPTVTAVYTQITDKQRQEAIQTLPALAPGTREEARS